MTTNLKTS
jgi:hypothetical protein